MVELEDWYFGNIERALAISKCKKDGDFVMRFNDIKQRYIITSRWKGQCSHYTLDVSFKKKATRISFLFFHVDYLFTIER